MGVVFSEEDVTLVAQRVTLRALAAQVLEQLLAVALVVYEPSETVTFEVVVS